MMRKKNTQILSNALNNGFWGEIFIEIIYSNSEFCRAYLGCYDTGIYAEGYGYNKNICIIGQVGLLIKTEDQNYKNDMKHAANGGGDMDYMVDIIAKKLSEMHNIRYIGAFQQTRGGFTVVFIKVADIAELSGLKNYVEALQDEIETYDCFIKGRDD
jgi:hypothetical protein